MLLQDILDQLTYGELSQIFMGMGECDKGIPDENLREVIGHISLGLTALHKRFRLRERTVKLQLVKNKNVYVLDKKFILDNGEIPSASKYLSNTEEDYFNDSILKIESIFLGEDICELLLNHKFNKCSIQTPSYNILKIPEYFVHKTDPSKTFCRDRLAKYDEISKALESLLAQEAVHSDTGASDYDKNVKDDFFTVMYRANHPKIDIKTVQYSPYNVNIELPETHLEALIYFVASRVHNPIGMTNEFHAGNSYFKKYEEECQKLEIFNYEIDNIGEHTRFYDNGFI